VKCTLLFGADGGSEEQRLSRRGYGRHAVFLGRLFERVLAVPEGAEVVEDAVVAPKRQPLSIADGSLDNEKARVNGAIGERERLCKNESLTGPWPHLGQSRSALLPPRVGPLRVCGGQEIEDGCGAVVVTRPHGFIHVLIAEDVPFFVARVVVHQAHDSGHTALPGHLLHAFHGGVVAPHLHQRGPGPFSRRG
jgi:hypothetical protein